MVVRVRGYVAWTIEKLEMNTGFLKKATNAGVIKMKPLSSEDFVYLVSSGENPDAKMIISVGDCNADYCKSVSGEVAKLVYQLINLVFVKKAPMPENMRYLVSMRKQFDTIIDAMAYVRKNYKLIPMITFSVLPGAKSVRVGIYTHLLRVDDTRKLRVKLKNGLGEEVYVPQVYDKIIASYIAETMFLKDSIQRQHTLGVHVDLIEVKKFIDVEKDNAWMGIAMGNRLLQVLWLQFTRSVSSEVFPVDYSIGKNPSLISILISKGALFTEGLIYPSNKLVEMAIQRAGIHRFDFVLEYKGVKGRSYRVLSLKDKSVRIDEKEHNLELKSIEEILGRLAMGSLSTISYYIRKA